MNCPRHVNINHRIDGIVSSHQHHYYKECRYRYTVNCLYTVWTAFSQDNPIFDIFKLSDNNISTQTY